MKDYKIFIYKDSTFPVIGLVPAGVYDVVNDNETYDREPSWAEIELSGKFVKLPIARHTFYDDVLSCLPYPVSSDFSPSFLNASTEAEMIDDLGGLRPYNLSVDEYLNGCESDDWDGFDGDAERAWRSAVLNDWSHRFCTRKKLDKIVYGI